MEDAEEDDESADESNYKSLTLHPDKSVLEDKKPDLEIKRGSQIVLEELRARLKKLKQEENASNMNVILVLFF